MKVFDMHIHTNGGEVKQNYLLEQMEKSGVYGGALISAQPEESTSALHTLPYKERVKDVLNWTKNQDGRLFPVLWVHPYEKDACDIVRDAADSGISAFKVICDTFHVYDPANMKLMEAIEKTELPVIFHSGILWSGSDTSRYNRPADWECLLNLKKGIKFSMGHCAWPWHDECIAVYGKFLNYYLNRGESSEMFFDTTPGTPKLYRKELFTKMFTVGYDVENNIMFGTDSVSGDYDADWVSGWLKLDNEIMDELGVTEEQRKKIYEGNFMRFLSGQDVKHKLPHMNK